MYKFLTTLITIVILIFLPTLSVRAEEIVDINNLVEEAKELDGQMVTIQGEAIGEPMIRGNNAWVNINDGTNAVGVWLSRDDAYKIMNYGNYKTKGDMVKITGIFYRDCREHGGEPDLHGMQVQIVTTGYAVQENVSTGKVISATLLSVVSLILVMFCRKIVLLYTIKL